MKDKESTLTMSRTGRKSPHQKRLRAVPNVESSNGVFCKTTARPFESNSSLLSSDTSFEKTFFFGKNNNNKSDTTLLNKDDMPDLDTFTGFEQLQRRVRVVSANLAGSTHGYKNEVYLAAALIFEYLATRKDVGQLVIQYPPKSPSPPQPAFTSQQTKRQAFELAYETLKYQELLEEILADSGYFFAHPVGEDMSALVMVMLFDFQNRKWGPRCQIIGDDEDKEVGEIDDNLMDHRVHLAASLARSRVEHQSQTIDYILPAEVRKQEKYVSSLPQYAWINTMKTSTDKLISSLESEKYVEFVGTEELIPSRGSYFRQDRHCEDVLIFPGDQKDVLKTLKIVENKELILQDKTSSLAVASMAALLTNDDDCDLIHTDVASGLTTAHLAVVLFNKTKKRREKRDLMYRKTKSSAEAGLSHVPDIAKVIAFGAGSEEQRLDLLELFQELGVNNVQLMTDSFIQCDPKWEGLEKVKAVLMTPRCTRTAVSNPIEFMLNEGDAESFDVLRDLSQGELHKKANQAGIYHTEAIRTVLKFRSIQAVVYVTRSVHTQENELAVNNALKAHRENPDGTKPFRVSPPTLPLLTTDIKTDSKKNDKPGNASKTSSSSLKHNYLRMRPSAQMNGCFIAVLSREVDPNDAIRRGALQGLITPASSEHHSAKAKVEDSVALPEKKSRKAPTSKTSQHAKSRSTSSVALKKSSIPFKVTSKPAVDASDVDKLLQTYSKSQKPKPTLPAHSPPPRSPLAQMRKKSTPDATSDQRPTSSIKKTIQTTVMQFDK